MMWRKRICTSTLLACCLLPVLADAAGKPPFKVRFHDLYTPTPDFQAFMNTLRQAAEKRDSKTLYGTVANNYYYARDFGGTFDAKASAVQNFKNTFNFAADGDYAWNSLEEQLAASKFQRIDGSICGEAEADPVGNVTNDDYWFEWVYINGENVRVRKQPSLESPVVANLSLVTVKALKAVPGELVKLSKRKAIYIDDAYVPNPDKYWIKIDTLTGKQGYVHSSFVSGFLHPKLCYKQVAGKWKIAGYIGGGD